MRSATKFLLVVLAVSIVRIAWEVVFADAYSRETVSTFLGMMWGALIVWGGATWELRRTPEGSRR